jgi:hypothetical protein
MGCCLAANGSRWDTGPAQNTGTSTAWRGLPTSDLAVPRSGTSWAAAWWLKGAMIRSAASAESGGQHHPQDPQCHPHQQHHDSCSKHYIHP